LCIGMTTIEKIASNEINWVQSGWGLNQGERKRQRVGNGRRLSRGKRGGGGGGGGWVGPLGVLGGVCRKNQRNEHLSVELLIEVPQTPRQVTSTHKGVNSSPHKGRPFEGVADRRWESWMGGLVRERKKILKKASQHLLNLRRRESGGAGLHKGGS